jgi:NAD(P)-dependent dehydrogenase (short-subunit alcohol dehydrogenase family)
MSLRSRPTSLAARAWWPNASKSFILSFSLALSQELHSQGITVSALCPGYTKTDFQAPSGQTWNLARLPGSTAMEGAETGYAGLIAGPRDCAWILERTRYFALAIFAKRPDSSGYFAVAAKSGCQLLKAKVRFGFLNCERCLDGSNLVAGF